MFKKIMKISFVLLLAVMLFTSPKGVIAAETCKIEVENALDFEATTVIGDITKATDFYKKTEKQFLDIAAELGIEKSEFKLSGKDVTVERGYYNDMTSVESYEVSATYAYELSSMDVGIKLVKALADKGIGAQLRTNESNECE